MDPKYNCYCGLCCENCAVKAKIVPAAKALRDEMKAGEFEEIIQFISGGEAFWSFLKHMAEEGTCTSCREGGGNPGCAVRICARDKGIDHCALCDRYPCELFDAFFKDYPILEHDNALLCEKGLEAWAKLQDERRASGFVYRHKKA